MIELQLCSRWKGDKDYPRQRLPHWLGHVGRNSCHRNEHLHLVCIGYNIICFSYRPNVPSWSWNTASARITTRTSSSPIIHIACKVSCAQRHQNKSFGSMMTGFLRQSFRWGIEPTLTQGRSTRKGVNQRSKDVTQAQQQRPESPALILHESSEPRSVSLRYSPGPFDSAEGWISAGIYSRCTLGPAFVQVSSTFFLKLFQLLAWLKVFFFFNVAWRPQGPLGQLVTANIGPLLLFTQILSSEGLTVTPSCALYL